METKQKKERIVITESMVRASFDLGKRLKNGTVEFKDAIAQLVEIGMNKNSAVDYLYFYPKLMANERFTRTTNAFATNYFLDRIYLEEGEEGLRIALNSLSEHLNYYENKAKVNVRSRRVIHTKFLAKLH